MDFRDSEFFKTILDVTPDNVFVKDRDFKYVYVNKAHYGLTGFHENEIIGKTDYDLVSKKAADRIRKEDHEVLEKGKTIDISEGSVELFKDKDLFFNLKKVPLKDSKRNVTHVLGIGRDITQHKQMEEELKKKEKRFRELSELLPEMAFETDIQGNITFINNNVYDKFGFTHKDLDGGLHGSQLIVPEDREKFKDNFTKRMMGKETGTTEYMALRKDGGTFPVLVHSNVIYDEEINPIGSRAIAIDITERKKVEEALKTSEKKHRAVFEQSSESIVLVDAETGELVEFNATAHKSLGYTRKEFKKLKITDFEVIESPKEVMRHIQKIRMKASDIFDTQHRTKSGEIKDILVKSKAISIDKKIYVQSVWIDITEQKRAEEKLKSSEKRLKILFESAPDAYYLNDLKGNFVDGNKMAEEITGYSRDELIGKSFLKLKLLSPLQIPKAAELLSKNVLGKSTGPDEFTLNKKDGSKVIVEIRTHPTKIKNQTLVLGIAHDITDRIKAEDELRFRSKTMNNVPDPIFMKDRDFKYVYVNKAHYGLTGFRENEIIGKTDYDIQSKGVADRLRKEDKRVFERGINVNIPEHKVEFFKNKQPIVYTKKVPLKDSKGNITHLIGVGRDITERKKIEDALKESQEEYRNIVEGAPDSIITLNMKGIITSCNPALNKMIGYSKDEIVGKHFLKLPTLYKKNRSHYVKAFGSLLKGNLQAQKVRWVHKDGTDRWTELHSSLMKEGHKLTGIQIIARDITERKQMEEKLLFHSEILGNTPDPVFIKDRDYKYVYVNRAYTENTGFSESEILGKTDYDVRDKETADRLRKDDMKVVEKGLSIKIPEDRHKYKNRIRIMSTKKTPFKDSNGNITHLIGVARDITERKKTEAALNLIEEEAARLEIRDKFISHATHELRTPLISIKGYTDYLLSGKMGKITDKVYSSLDVVKRNSDRLLSLVNDLLDIRRMDKGKLQVNLEPLDFGEIIYDCAREIHPFIQEKKQQLRILLPDTSFSVRGDTVRLCQVVMNLLSNASKFTPEGGEITLHAIDEEDTVKTEISDQGIGIRKKDLTRVFEPFADITKDTYVKGTGLGLSVTKGLVEAHGGKIWVTSKGEGKGTTITFTLPKQKER